MTKEELKTLLEDYWYDDQYLKEKAKELENVKMIIKDDSSLGLLNSIKNNEEIQMLNIIEKKKYIESLFLQLPQHFRTLMYMKYISFLTFDQMADRMHYSTKRIYQLHSEGFQILLNIINNKSMISTN